MTIRPHRLHRKDVEQAVSQWEKKYGRLPSKSEVAKVLDRQWSRAIERHYVHVMVTRSLTRHEDLDTLLRLVHQMRLLVEGDVREEFAERLDTCEAAVSECHKKMAAADNARKKAARRLQSKERRLASAKKSIERSQEKAARLQSQNEKLKEELAKAKSLAKKAEQRASELNSLRESALEQMRSAERMAEISEGSLQKGFDRMELVRAASNELCARFQNVEYYIRQFETILDNKVSRLDDRIIHLEYTVTGQQPPELLSSDRPSPSA